MYFYKRTYIYLNMHVYIYIYTCIYRYIHIHCIIVNIQRYYTQGFFYCREKRWEKGGGTVCKDYHIQYKELHITGGRLDAYHEIFIF